MQSSVGPSGSSITELKREKTGAFGRAAGRRNHGCATGRCGKVPPREPKLC